MRQRNFGSSDASASVIGFGTWALGSDWWGDTDEPAALITHALNLGITYFETGDVYGQGANEELVGEALKKSGVSRESFQIATKFGYVVNAERKSSGDSERPQDFSPKHVKAAVEESLKRLQTDYIDVYQLHNPRMEAVQRADLFEALEELKVAGKIRAFGVALGPAIGWREEGLKALTEHSIDALQTVYNMLERDPGDDLAKTAAEQGSSLIARVPTASGLLEDNLTKDTEFSGNDHRRYRPKEWLLEGLDRVEKYRFLTEDTGRTMAQAAIKFILSCPQVTTVLPTVTRISELNEWAAAGGDTVPDLSTTELEKIDQIYEEDFARKIGGPLRSSVTN